MKTFIKCFRSVANACPYSMAAKKCVDVARGKNRPDARNTDRIEKYRNGIKMGRNVALIGLFCPFLWYSILSGKSMDFIVLNLIHSGIIAGIGLLLVVVNMLAISNYREKK